MVEKEWLSDREYRIRRDHDPLCPYVKWHDGSGLCLCVLLRQARDSERERIARAFAVLEADARKTLEQEWDAYMSGRRDAWDEAERIARELPGRG